MDIPRESRPGKPKLQAALLGLAFDAQDGHKRITRGPNFLLAGGSNVRSELARVYEIGYRGQPALPPGALSVL